MWAPRGAGKWGYDCKYTVVLLCLAIVKSEEIFQEGSVLWIEDESNHRIRAREVA